MGSPLDAAKNQVKSKLFSETFSNCVAAVETQNSRQTNRLRKQVLCDYVRYLTVI